MFKEDPLEPLRVYFKDYVITGIGLFLEGTMLDYCPFVALLSAKGVLSTLVAPQAGSSSPFPTTPRCSSRPTPTAGVPPSHTSAMWCVFRS